MDFIFSEITQIKKKFKKEIESIYGYTKYLREEVVKKNTYDYAESSINCSTDPVAIQKVLKLVKSKKTRQLKYIFLVGIGGSNLGTKAFYDALTGYFDILNPRRMPKIIFLDTCHAAFLGELNSLLKEIKNPDEILVNIISKSGETTETMVNLEILVDTLKRHIKAIENRIVITTDYQSQLWLLAEKRNLSLLAIPQKVGGRFSVFSAVGLFPLALLGLNIKKILANAAKMRDICLEANIDKNLALQSALLLYSAYQSGKIINDNFFFNPELESLGKWYRQLMGESIGKEKDLNGKIIHSGITPTVSIGSTDLHSMGQLYLGGPKDKFTTFVWANTNRDQKIPRYRLFPEITPQIDNKKTSQIMSAIFSGVKKAYERQDLPFAEIHFNKISIESLAEFMQFKMIEIMFLGKLMNINTFDQPNVEIYKEETRKILN